MKGVLDGGYVYGVVDVDDECELFFCIWGELLMW